MTRKGTNENKKLLTRSNSSSADDDSLTSNSSSSDSGLEDSTTRSSSSSSLATRVFWALLKFCIGISVFYKTMASPPMHWFYDPLPQTSNATTIYLPGGGFSGLFYHLGFLDSIDLEQRKKYDYYCYSSGCIAAMASLTNLTLEQSTNAGIATQEEWLDGSVSIYEFTQPFVAKLLAGVDDETLEAILPGIKILVTSPYHGGAEVHVATNRQEFSDLMIKTTWLPYVTGWGMLHEGRSMDGGFSRRLHPKCDFDVYVPIYWEITKKTFTPAISRSDAFDFWRAGFAHSQLEGTQRRPNGEAVEHNTCSSSSTTTTNV